MNKGKIKLITILAALAIILTTAICIYAFSASKAQDKGDNAADTTTEPEKTNVITPPVYESNNGSEEETTTDVPSGDDETTSAEKSLEYLSSGNGTCTVVGKGNVTDSCIIIPEKSPDGEVVVGIGAKAFYCDDTINAVQIPSTVTSVGEMAFGGCTSLIYISVSPENTCFEDRGGILYSADGATLLHYPALRGNASLDIGCEVKTISAMAFYSCDSLKYINYAGTLADWAAINVGEINYSLFAISVQCKE